MYGHAGNLKPCWKSGTTILIIVQALTEPNTTSQGSSSRATPRVEELKLSCHDPKTNSKTISRLLNIYPNYVN